jgi:hypothetical protein
VIIAAATSVFISSLALSDFPRVFYFSLTALRPDGPTCGKVSYSVVNDQVAQNRIGMEIGLNFYFRCMLRVRALAFKLWKEIFHGYLKVGSYPICYGKRWVSLAVLNH